MLMALMMSVLAVFTPRPLSCNLFEPSISCHSYW